MDVTSGAEKKWKRFEDLAAHIQRTLSPQSRVEQNVRVKGRASGVERQIDIAVWTQAGQFELFVAIDCKDYNTKVDVKDVEAFVGMVRDVGANKGALVSALGYTPAAKKVADAAGISVYTLVDAESEDWPAFVSIPVLIDDRTIDGVSYTVSSMDMGRGGLDISDIPNKAVFRGDGTRLGPVKDLLSKMWNEDRLPKHPGEHGDIHLGDEPTYLQTTAGPVRFTLTASIRISRTLYFGQLPLVKVQGFRDDIRGGIHTQSITTDWVVWEKVKETWQVVPSEESLAVKPVLVQFLATYYPLEGDPLDDDAAQPAVAADDASHRR